MDFLNQLCSSSPSVDGFVKHPLGKYNGLVTKVTQSFNKKLNKNCWDIEIKTTQGAAPSVTVFGFSDQDIAQLQYNQEARDKAQKTIGRLKNMLSSVLRIPKTQIDSCTWDQLIGFLAQLQGKGVSIEVVVDSRDSNYHRTYINGPADGDIQPSRPVEPQMGTSPILQQLTSNRGYSQSSSIPPMPPHSTPSLDDIPF